jgi:flagellar biosynthetic protein FliQ
MTPESVINIVQQAVQVAVLVSAPMLLSGLAVGLLVSVFQAATSINEMTLSFIPKLLVTFIVMVAAGPWMLELMVDYMRRLFESIPGLIG